MSASPLNVTVIEKQNLATPVTTIEYNPFHNPSSPPLSSSNPPPPPSEYSTDSDSEAEVNISHISTSSSESTQNLISNTISAPLTLNHPSNPQVEHLPSTSNKVTASQTKPQTINKEKRTSTRKKKKN